MPRRCGELHGEWPECCGFVILPESQSQWVIMKHRSLNVKPADLGVKLSDQTWHHEQWLHLKFAAESAGGTRLRQTYTPDFATNS